MQIRNNLYQKLHSTNENDISPEKLAQFFAVSAAHNELEEVKQYLTNHPHLLQANKYEGIRLAAENGAQEVLSYLLSQATHDQIEESLKSKDCYAFCLAAQGGHIENMKLLWNATNNNLLKNNMFSSKNYFAFGSAIRSDRPAVIKFLWSIADNDQKTFLLDKLSKREPTWSLFKINSQEDVIGIIETILSNLPTNLVPAAKLLAKYYNVSVKEERPDLSTTLSNRMR